MLEKDLHLRNLLHKFVLVYHTYTNSKFSQLTWGEGEFILTPLLNEVSQGDLNHSIIKFSKLRINISDMKDGEYYNEHSKVKPDQQT